MATAGFECGKEYKRSGICVTERIESKIRRKLFDRKLKKIMDKSSAHRIKCENRAANRKYTQTNTHTHLSCGERTERVASASAHVYKKKKKNVKKNHYAGSDVG